MRTIQSTLEFKIAQACGHNCASSRGDDAYHGRVNFIERSQMIQRSTSYPIKMAALVIGQISVLAVLVWMSH